MLLCFLGNGKEGADEAGWRGCGKDSCPTVRKFRHPPSLSPRPHTSFRHQLLHHLFFLCIELLSSQCDTPLSLFLVLSAPRALFLRRLLQPTFIDMSRQVRQPRGSGSNNWGRRRTRQPEATGVSTRGQSEEAGPSQVSHTLNLPNPASPSLSTVDGWSTNDHRLRADNRTRHPRTSIRGSRLPPWGAERKPWRDCQYCSSVSGLPTNDRTKPGGPGRAPTETLTT